MSVFRRTHEVRQWQPEPIIPPFPGVRTDGSGIVSPSSSDALQVSAVWACVRLISETVAMMPVSAYRWQDTVRVPMAPPSLLRQPTDDPSTPFSAFIYECMVSLLLRGNAYAQVLSASIVGGHAYPTTVRLLNPDKVTVKQDESGMPVYFLGPKKLANADVIHLKAFRFPGMAAGLSPIQFAATSIGTDAAVGQFAFGFFKDGAHPSALLTTSQNLNQEQAATTKKRFLASIRGREPAVLSGGMEYKQIQVSPNESQFLETQKYGVAEICRIFGVPPEMVASDVSNSMTYANVEQRSIDFLTYTIQPWLTRLEDAFALLLPAQQHIRFDTSVLTRTDYETLMKATAIGIASKQMTPDEARAKRDEAPLTDEQKAWLSIIPLDVSPTGLPKAVPIGNPAPTNPDLAAPDDDPTEGEGA